MNMAGLFRIAAICGFLVVSSQAEELTREETNFFESKIRPVLIRECYGCHSNKTGNARGGLRLDTRELMAIGGATGPAIVPGDLDESWLYNAITHQDFVMPPKRKLSAEIIDDFRRWIEMGAPDPRSNTVSEIRSNITDEDISTAKENFWAYQKPVMTEAPASGNWATSNIDKFVAAKLSDSNMKPADDAEAYKVLRRLTFDLIGLPPTPAQIEIFTERWKKNPDYAVNRVVELLLDDKQFGERWGRHWLDVVRYAESTGREVNMTYPEAWRYRDYVIDSFNADKPFDKFLTEQIAGDLLPAATDEAWAANLVATTFLAVGPKNLNEQNRVQFAADVADEQIDATTRVFLGMSVACARCHDHKFDAIPQTDYYALAGVFKNMTTYFGNVQSDFGTFSSAQAKQDSTLLILPVEDPNPFDPRYSASELADLKKEMTDKLQQMSSLRRNRSQPNSQRDRLRLLNELQELSGKIGEVDSNGKPRSYTMGVQEFDRPGNARVLVRGEIDQPAQQVKRGFPQVLCATPVSINPKSSGRLELAKWMSSKDNPLTARVMVNRIWKHLIGKGLVTSMENFGVTGQQPSHPELLDYLAVRFMESDWSVKEIVREIATSRIYRASSEFDETKHEQDPENALIWRANPRRLDAEAIRDAMLAISGELDPERPRGSLVAEVGYTRVQGGVVGDARQMARDAVQKAREEAIQNGRSNSTGRPFFGGRTNQQRGTTGRPSQGGRFQQGQQQRPGQRMNQQRPSGQQSRQQTNRPDTGQGTGQRMGMGRGRSGMAGGNSDLMAEVLRKVTSQLDMEDAKFRSVYLPIVRDEEPRSLEVFDFADSSSIIGQREASNTANQALYMLNNPFVMQQSEALAQRIAKEQTNVVDQINLAFMLAYGRPPTLPEKRAASSFARSFAAGAESERPTAQQTMAAICQSLIGSAEFRYLD